LGGGMITDIGGFAASTYKRGMRFINVPTSLLGMVDAAIGGKTGANLGSAKNQVGSFALPEAVIICPVFLKTLPEEELISGYAEIVKIALAFDKELWEQIKDIKVQKEQSEQLIKKLSDVILWKSIQIKVSTVQKDMHDRNIRQGLNFGHSIGHALEAFYQSKGRTLPHGFAVAAGIICEAYISTKLSSLKYRSFQDIEDYIHATFPSIEIKKSDIDNICIMLRHDKKNIRGDFRMSLLEAPGKIKVGVICPEEVIRESLSHYISN
jgi:3-dehydroquinate synthase